MIAATLFAMTASAVLGYATVALNGNELGLIGSIIGGVCTIIATLMTISAASRRQRRELRYQRKGSGMTGFLLGLLLISIGAAFYFASRPGPEADASDARVPSTIAITASTAPPTTLPAVVPTASTEPPITLGEASAFVSSYFELANNEATESQAWTVFTDAHTADLNKNHHGTAGFHVFWQNVDTVTLKDKPSFTSESTPSRAVVRMPLTYRMFTKPACVFDEDDFAVVRIDGVLKIDDATTFFSKPC